MKIFVAIPVYDGKLQIQTVKCLLEESTLAGLSGDQLQVAFLPACSTPAAGRNQLVEQFLDSECERLVFLDADITFETGDLLKIAHHKKDFVGGCYRFKTFEEKYPITLLESEFLQADEHGLLEVKTIPTGFLSLSREVFNKFREAYPGREYMQTGHKAYAFFQQVFAHGIMHSDDMYFCREWTDAGGKIYLDPELLLTHWDFNPTPIIGHIGNWLRGQITDEDKYQYLQTKQQGEQSV